MDIKELIDLFREEAPGSSSDLKQIWAVFWVNFKIFLSYRTWVLTETLSTVVSMVMYFFMGLQVDATRLIQTDYGDIGWLAFALIGVASSNYLWMCIGRIGHAVLREVREGTFERIISTPIRLRSYLIGQSIRGFLVGGYFMFGALLVGTVLFRAPLVITFETVVSLLVIILVMIISYTGIGVMVAGLILVYKRGNPLTFLFAHITEFLGGVLFPLNYLKDYTLLWALAWMMPYTYALDAARRIVLTGATLISPPVFNDLIVLTIFTIVFIPLGLRVFRWGSNRIRIEGTASAY